MAFGSLGSIRAAQILSKSAALAAGGSLIDDAAGIADDLVDDVARVKPPTLDPAETFQTTAAADPGQFPGRSFEATVQADSPLTSRATSVDPDVFAPNSGLPTPQVSNPKLNNLVNDLYKGAKTPNPIGTGSTADAVRNELLTGLPTGGRFHSQKAQDYINALQNFLRKNPNASNHDRMVAQSLLDDLTSALAGN